VEESLCLGASAALASLVWLQAVWDARVLYYGLLWPYVRANLYMHMTLEPRAPVEGHSLCGISFAALLVWHQPRRLPCVASAALLYLCGISRAALLVWHQLRRPTCVASAAQPYLCGISRAALLVWH